MLRSPDDRYDIDDRCDLQPHKAGQWWYPQQLLRMSGEAAIVLSEAGKLRLDDLEPLRT